MREFTVLLAAHDRLELLREAVESALASSGPLREVLVVDDGSGSETAAWLDRRSAEDPRLRVLHQENQGVGAARDRGLREARTEWITVLDSDDLLHPDALLRIDRELSSHPDTDLLYADHDHLLPNGECRVVRYRAFSSNRAMLWATFLSPKVPFKHSGTSFRRRTALECGGYDREIGIKIDIEFFLRFLAAGRRVRHLGGGPVVSFRTHSQSMSRRRWRGIRAWWVILDRYGPRFPPLRWTVKGVRASWELAKAVYAGVAWRDR